MATWNLSESELQTVVHNIGESWEYRFRACGMLVLNRNKRISSLEAEIDRREEAAEFEAMGEDL